ncbi:MAG: hypothetical protein KDD10_30205, partial [Phaeodactylibacter sp.]|nr:hypothetical protein [Phaeodactylibacter sp.]
DNNGGGFLYAQPDSDVAVDTTGTATVQALRGRKISGMPPNSARVFVYDPRGGGEYGYSAADSDITVDTSGSSKVLKVSKIQDLRVDFSGGVGDGMVLTCVDPGNGPLQFECRTPSGGFSLPYSQSVNLGTTMFSITNNSTASNLTGMQVDNRGRYGIRGVSREGQANFNLSALNSFSFTYPAAVYGEHLNSSQAGAAVFGKAVSSADNNEGIGGLFMGKSAGVLAVGYSGGVGAVVGYGAGTRAGYFEGDVDVNGSISSNLNNFRIDHPQDPANRYLYHTSVESPDMKNIYDGIVTTDAGGYATVELPGYFGSLNKDCRYQLTCIGQFAQAIIAQKVENNRFVIRTDKPNVEVSWQVTGIRKDPYAEAHRTVPEVEKPAEERGTYINPELYGQPQEKKLGWDRINREF